MSASSARNGTAHYGREAPLVPPCKWWIINLRDELLSHLAFALPNVSNPAELRIDSVFGGSSGFDAGIALEALRPAVEQVVAKISRRADQFTLLHAHDASLSGEVINRLREETRGGLCGSTRFGGEATSVPVNGWAPVPVRRLSSFRASDRGRSDPGPGKPGALYENLDRPFGIPPGHPNTAPPLMQQVADFFANRGAGDRTRTDESAARTIRLTGGSSPRCRRRRGWDSRDGCCLSLGELPVFYRSSLIRTRQDTPSRPLRHLLSLCFTRA